MDASRAQSILDAAVSLKLAQEAAKLEEVAVLAAASSGADVVLVQEQLGEKSELAFGNAFSKEQLAQLLDAAAPSLEVS